MRICLIFFSFLLFALSLGRAEAHRPYFKESAEIILANGESMQMRFAYGDGLFGPDPIRAVLVDKDGIIVAVGGLTRSLFLDCFRLVADNGCVAFDPEHRVAYVPDPVSFGHHGKVTDDDRPPWYPEEYPGNPEIVSGFVLKPIGWWGTLLFEISNIIRHPIGVLILFGLLVAIWLNVLRLFRRAANKTTEDTTSADLQSLGMIGLFVFLLATLFLFVALGPSSTQSAMISLALLLPIMLIFHFGLRSVMQKRRGNRTP
ncbi:hypothetical protein [uncultured Roseibium sp.]|uniref:hypothetical protein n=1 Tax=uncultured Roseibium sp. TaxID=1936171 RepID=UPI0032168D61